MSSKYEREIEEILRNIETARPSVGDRIRSINRRPATRPPAVRPSFGTEARFVTGIALIFAAATVRWITQAPAPLLDVGIGVATLAGFALIAGTVIAAWMNGGAGRPGWRGNPLNAPRGGQGPAPTRGPFASLATRWNLLKLRLRYRRDR